MQMSKVEKWKSGKVPVKSAKSVWNRTSETWVILFFSLSCCWCQFPPDGIVGIDGKSRNSDMSKPSWSINNNKGLKFRANEVTLAFLITTHVLPQFRYQREPSTIHRCPHNIFSHEILHLPIHLYISVATYWYIAGYSRYSWRSASATK